MSGSMANMKSTPKVAMASSVDQSSSNAGGGKKHGNVVFFSTKDFDQSEDEESMLRGGKAD